MSNTLKHKDFCREPMYNKPISDIPGVGIVLKRKLNSLGYYKAKDLYNLLKSLGFSESNFYLWMKKNCNGGHVHSCYKALKEWHNQFTHLEEARSAAENEEANNPNKRSSDRVRKMVNGGRPQPSVQFNVREREENTIAPERVQIPSNPWGSDPTSSFFFSMSETVKKFPRLLQSKVKSQVFEIINDADAKQAQDEDERRNGLSSSRGSTGALTRGAVSIDIDE